MPYPENVCISLPGLMALVGQGQSVVAACLTAAYGVGHCLQPGQPPPLPIVL